MSRCGTRSLDGRGSLADYPEGTFEPSKGVTLPSPVPRSEAANAVLADQAAVQAATSAAVDDLQTERWAVGGLGASALVAVSGLDRLLRRRK